MVSRRSYLSKAGAVGAAGLLAGCTGDDDGDGRNTVDIAMAPLGMMVMIADIMEEEGILESYEEELGVEYNLQQTWDMVSLFAGDQVDMVVSVGAAEAAQIGPQREIEITAHGVMLTQYPGMIVSEDSEYATSETGSLQASWDRIQEDQANVGIGGWGLSMTPLSGLIHDEEYGYSFQEGGDYNIVTADYASLPTLLANGELDVAQTAPLLDATSLNYDMETGEMDGFEALYWYTEKMEELGYDPMSTSIGNFLTRTSYSEENYEAVEGFVRAWQEALDIFYNEDPVEFATDYVDQLNAEDEAEAQAMVHWSTNIDPMVLPESVEIDDQFVENDRAALERMGELGVVGEDWQDWLNYDPVSI